MADAHVSPTSGSLANPERSAVHQARKRMAIGNQIAAVYQPSTSITTSACPAKL